MHLIDADAAACVRRAIETKQSLVELKLSFLGDGVCHTPAEIATAHIVGLLKNERDVDCLPEEDFGTKIRRLPRR
jgi:hypothetical protein